jgi:hypothetical protein
LSGTTVFSGTYQSQSVLNVDISGFPKGMYLVKLTNSQETYSAKCVTF